MFLKVTVLGAVRFQFFFIKHRWICGRRSRGSTKATTILFESLRAGNSELRLHFSAKRAHHLL